MNLSCKLITMFPEQFEHKNVANSMENERFGRKNVAITADMAASSSKILQIARKMDRTGNQKKTQNGRTILKQFRTQSKTCKLIFQGLWVWQLVAVAVVAPSAMPRSFENYLQLSVEVGSN